ncbi:MAG: carboxypeptidase-like regulatory domain-containing protein [Planctomycetaceae bacterium]|jgi:hypothetical protein|nr:carboxypeptidase-like regulatory domain-containing protein [Planctomycetaceae bacterium]
MQITRSIRFVIFVFLGFLVGCSSAEIPVYNVSGTVTYQGKPVAGALVSFVPEVPEIRGAAAMTDSNGQFVVVTQGAKENGAMYGKYKITVTKLIEVDNVGNEVIRKPVAEYNPNNKQVEIQYKQKNLLPEKYSKQDTTDLTVTVEKRKNNFKLELTD